MAEHSRYAIYFVPQGDALAAFGADWLGWDGISGNAPRDDRFARYASWTAMPRKYGFHGTLKPPFRLAPGTSVDALSARLSDVAATLAPARCDGLKLAHLGEFLALIPYGDTETLAHVAGRLMQDLDGFRAPASTAELARRRAAGLTARQEAMLAQWGYPFVLDEFRFHLTLTGRLNNDEAASAQEVLRAALPPLPAPFELAHIALVGERADGNFELIDRVKLRGPA